MTSVSSKVLTCSRNIKAETMGKQQRNGFNTILTSGIVEFRVRVPLLVYRTNLHLPGTDIHSLRKVHRRSNITPFNLNTEGCIPCRSTTDGKTELMGVCRPPHISVTIKQLDLLQQSGSQMPEIKASQI